MVSFVRDGRARLAIRDKRGAILDVGMNESERTARSRLIVMNFRRPAGLSYGDLLFRTRRKMNGDVAANEICLELVAGARRRDKRAGSERFDADSAGRIAGVTRCDERRHVQSNRDEQAIEADDCAKAPLISKALTSARHAVRGMTKAVESRRYGALPKRFACNRNPAPRKRHAFALHDVEHRARSCQFTNVCAAQRDASAARRWCFADVAEWRQYATNCGAGRAFAELLGEVLVDTATVACAWRCRTRASGCPMTTGMPMSK
jgi:hypothetical protein